MSCLCTMRCTANNVVAGARGQPVAAGQPAQVPRRHKCAFPCNCRTPTAVRTCHCDDCRRLWAASPCQSTCPTPRLTILCHCYNRPSSVYNLQALVGSLSLPDNLLKSLAGTFQPGSLLICRSSANVEDLAGMSGAGLYESVPNVPSDRPGDISAAVAAVWASLYTRRAILSRRAAGEADAIKSGV